MGPSFPGCDVPRKRRGSVSGGRLVEPPLNSHPVVWSSIPAGGRARTDVAPSRTTPTTRQTRGGRKEKRARKGGHAHATGRAVVPERTRAIPPSLSHTHTLSRPVALFAARLVGSGCVFPITPPPTCPRRSSSVAPTEPPSLLPQIY